MIAWRTVSWAGSTTDSFDQQGQRTPAAAEKDSQTGEAMGECFIKSVLPETLLAGAMLFGCLAAAPRAGTHQKTDELLCSNADGSMAAYGHGKRLMILDLRTGRVTRVGDTFDRLPQPKYIGARVFGE